MGLVQLDTGPNSYPIFNCSFFSFGPPYLESNKIMSYQSLKLPLLVFHELFGRL